MESAHSPVPDVPHDRRTDAVRRAAYCDVDGTLARTNIVKPLMWYKKKLLSAPRWKLWELSLLFRGPWWLLLDRIDRALSNRAIYSHYRGIPAGKAREMADDCYKEYIQPRLFDVALNKLESFQREGTEIVLVSGNLDFLILPLAKRFGATIVAPRLLEDNGVFTGELDRPPLTGESKAACVREHSLKNKIELKESFALGDAWGDLPMLECVGYPIAVNADSRLAQVAFKRGWRQERY